MCDTSEKNGKAGWEKMKMVSASWQKLLKYAKHIAKCVSNLDVNSNETEIEF
jgi:hypothetical protein